MPAVKARKLLCSTEMGSQPILSGALRLLDKQVGASAAKHFCKHTENAEPAGQSGSEGIAGLSGRAQTSLCEPRPCQTGAVTGYFFTIHGRTPNCTAKLQATVLAWLQVFGLHPASDLDYYFWQC